MQTAFATMLALLLLAPIGHAQAAPRRQITIPTPNGKILVEHFAGSGTEPRPAVLILSGSKGLAASSYDEIGQMFSASGLDAYLVHLLTPTDLNAIANAGSAGARIKYYDARLPDWTSTVHDVISYLDAQSRHARKIGVLGISLGAQIAAVVSAETKEIGALVLVDGGFPIGSEQPIRPMPPLLLIWGGADQVFPLSAGQKLHRKAKALGGVATLDIYEGAAHDFFLQPGAQQARSAQRSAADFLLSKLSR